MPSLVAFQRHWNIGSDDFVFPEITEVIFRVTWIAFGISVFVFHFPLSCTTQNLTIHFTALLLINAVTILLALLTAFISAKGTIMDSNPRKLIPTLLHIRLPIFLSEIAWTVVATFHAFRSTIGEAGCDFAIIARVTIVLEWFLIATAVIGIVIVFHLTDSEVEDREVVAHRSWSRRMKICKIGQDDSMRAALDDVALLISSFFVDSDLVFSDVLAGLLLAYHSPNNEYPPVWEKRSDSRPSWMNIENAEYFLHHATCVYGWPTYMLYNCNTRSYWRLWSKLQCCGKMRCEQCISITVHNMELEERKTADYLFKGQAMVVEDNCCYCNTAAVVLTNETRNMDLAFMSFRNRVYEVPFAVIADHEKHAIVVTIRGSCSLIDLVTDLCLEDELLTIDVDQDATLCEDCEIDRRGDVRVHRGMLRSARYVFETLEKNKILNDLFVVHPGYQLVICGHSLGAGVGALLTMLLKQEYPNIRCFSYAPPGCVISEFGQDEMEKYVLSVVSGDDIVSRISYQSLHKLRERIFDELMSCQRAKFTILIRGVYQLFFKFPWEDEGLSGVRRARSVDLESALLSRRNLYGGTQQRGSLDGDRRQRIQLYAPGRIMYISEVEEEITTQWIDPKSLSDIKLSVSALSDHMTPTVQRFLKNATSQSSRLSSPITSQPD